MNFRKLILPAAMLLASIQAGAQGISIRALDYSPFIKQGAEGSISWGVGYEQNLAKYLSLSLSYNSSYGSSQGYEGEYSYYDALGSGYNFYYNQQYKWHEIAYQSSYFFAGNDEHSGYLSSGIAYRSVEHVTNVSSYYADPGYEDIAATLSQQYFTKSFSLIPISFKLGLRGDLDGIFGDLYVGITFIPGASGKINEPGSFLDGKTTQAVNGFSTNFGLKIGIGWDN